MLCKELLDRKTVVLQEIVAVCNSPLNYKFLFLHSCLYTDSTNSFRDIFELSSEPIKLFPLLLVPCLKSTVTLLHLLIPAPFYSFHCNSSFLPFFQRRSSSSLHFTPPNIGEKSMTYPAPSSPPKFQPLTPPTSPPRHMNIAVNHEQCGQYDYNRLQACN